MLMVLIIVVLARNKRWVSCEPHFYRLRKEAVGKIGCPVAGRRYAEGTSTAYSSASVIANGPSNLFLMPRRF